VQHYNIKTFLKVKSNSFWYAWY